MTDAASLRNYELIHTIDGIQRYDVHNNPIVSQLFVPVGIEDGGTFQMHYGRGHTVAVNWTGSLEQSVDRWIDDNVRALF